MRIPYVDHIFKDVSVTFYVIEKYLAHTHVCSRFHPYTRHSRYDSHIIITVSELTIKKCYK
jgi:hypothetical protein